MSTLTFDNIIPSSVPPFGWTIRYREAGSTSPYNVVSNIMSSPITISVPEDILDFEGTIERECEQGQFSSSFSWTASKNLNLLTYNNLYAIQFNNNSLAAL